MKTFKDIFIVLFISLLLLCAIEIISRIIYKGEPNRAAVDPGLLAYEFDSLTLVRMKPDVTKVFIRNKVNGGDTIYWSTDKHGFRYRPNKPSSQRSIMVFGDSNIQGRFSLTENTYCGQLEALLDSTAVINAGTIGFGPDQSFLKIKQTIDKFQPKLIILQVFADNDFGDILRNRLFEFDAKGTFKRTALEPLADIRLSGKFPETKPLLRTVELFQHINRHYLKTDHNSDDEKKEFHIKSIRDLCENEFEVYKDKTSSKYSVFSDHYDMDIAICPDCESSETKIQLMEQLLLSVKGFVHSKNAKLFILIQPSTIDLTANFNISYKDLEAFKSYESSRLCGIIEEICIKNNIRHLNLFPIFKENKPSQLFFKYPNNHWNDAGQLLAASKTFEMIN